MAHKRRDYCMYRVQRKHALNPQRKFTKGPQRDILAVHVDQPKEEPPPPPPPLNRDISHGYFYSHTK